MWVITPRIAASGGTPTRAETSGNIVKLIHYNSAQFLKKSAHLCIFEGVEESFMFESPEKAFIKPF